MQVLALLEANMQVPANQGVFCLAVTANCLGFIC